MGTRPIVACISASIACATISGAGGPDSELAGTVLDRSGKPPPAAVVTVGASNGSRPECHVTRSDSSGRFHVARLPGGEYDVVAEKAGYDAAWLRHFRVEAPVTSVDLVLAPLEEFPSARPAWQKDQGEGLQPGWEAPSRLAGPDPIPSVEAIEHGVHGQMLIACVITVRGSVERCRIVKGLPYLDDVVLDALRARK